MSSIEKLSIQGIRSFGANAEDAQSITFSSPVTLILGENGCGKTTIIECLKYALTGECPPGGDHGKSFVHDPKIFSLVDTLGQIKLQVRNVNGNRLSVCRSMKITNRRGQCTFETLDATLNYLKVDDDGSKSSTDSLSKRCIDVDVAMCQFMGVSKAIINNVLFCHQEDSSWPLDEPLKLKKKFDAIFGITEYNTTIDKIIKMRKEEMQEKQLKDANLNLLSHLKDEMEAKTMAFQKAKDKSDTIKKKCARCEDEMKPIEERMQEIRDIELEVGKQQRQKIEIETQVTNCKEQIFNLEKKIKKPFQGDLEALIIEIENFEKKMSQKCSEYTKAERQLDMLQLEEKSLEKSLTDIDMKLCILAQKRQNQNDCVETRTEKMKLLCEMLNINIKNDLSRKENILNILNEIEVAINNEQSLHKEKTEQFDELDIQRQKEIDEMRINVTKTEEGLNLQNKQRQTHLIEIKQMEKKVTEMKNFSERLSKLASLIDKNDKTMEDIKSRFDQDEWRQKITQQKVKVSQLNNKYREIDERLTVLSTITKHLTEIDLKNREISKKEQEVRRFKSKHCENFQRVMGKPVESNFRRTMQLKYEQLRTEIKDLNDKLHNLKLKTNTLEIERKNMKEKLSAAEKTLEESKETIFDKCHSMPYEELVLKTKTTVEKYQQSHGAYLSAKNLYKKYIEKIEEHPCCPLCHKDMTSNEASDIVSELTDEILHLPDTIMRSENMLKEEEKTYHELLKLKPMIDEVSHLQNDIPLLKKKLHDVEEEIVKRCSETESVKMLLVEPTTNMELVNAIMGDMSVLDETLKELSRLKQEVEQFKKNIPGDYNTDVSVEMLQMEKAAITVEMDEERQQIESDQQHYDECIDMIAKLREKKNLLKDEEFKLKENLQNLPELKKRQKELKRIVQEIELAVETAQINLVSLREELSEAVAQKDNQKKLERQIVLKMREKIESHKTLDNEIKRLNKEAEDYEKLNLNDDIEMYNTKVQTLGNILKEKRKQLEETTDFLRILREECSNQQTLERDLKDNRELKILQQRLLELEERSNKLSQQLGDLEFRKVSNEKNKLNQLRDELTVQKAELLGQLGEINNQINKLQAEMEDPKLKESVIRYRKAAYEVEISRRLIADLGQYRIALEWSLIQFHKEKMEKINRIIREYWRLIYRGNDIDYIQIQTDGLDTNSSADKRRNYKYRVVQSKNDSVIEMRGRCSAGQRVLASLIIRMALAETFSSNCGVLALDEPTTNLDVRNITSLCNALNRIVEERQTQSNFLLIIITHDEKFISSLGKINSYYRVYRSEECKSIIRKVKVA